jgi:hypothetical protein
MNADIRPIDPQDIPLLLPLVDPQREQVNRMNLTVIINLSPESSIRTQSDVPVLIVLGLQE